MAIENINEIIEYINTNADSEEVKTFKQGLAPKLTVEGVQAFLETEADGIAYLQRHTDKAVTKGINTYKSNNLMKEVEKEIAKRNPQKSEAEIQMETLRQEVELMKREKSLSDMKVKYTKELVDKGLNSFSDFILSDDEEMVKSNIAKFEELINPLIDTRVNEKLKASSYTPPNNDTKGDRITKSQLMKLPIYEIQKFKNENPDLYNEIMKG